MDLLGDIVATLDLKATLYFRAELTAPFSIAVPEDRQVIRFHVVSEGVCWIETPQGDSVEGQAGDLVLVPHGAAHVLASTPASRPLPLPIVLRQTGYTGSGPLVFGGDGPRAVLVCGYFGFAQAVVHPVIASLPGLIHIRHQGERQYTWLAQMLEHMGYESRTEPQAWAEVVRRLSEVLFIQVLREYVAGHPNATGALMALGDARLGKALRAMHSEPHKPWSVEELAGLASMSRSAFAEHFRASLGVSPARYLTAWRLHKARAMLASTRVDLQQVADAVGYSSEAAFSRAFKEQFGEPPGRYRSARVV